MKQPLVSIITVNFNQAGVTADLLRSLACLHYRNFEVIVVDNASAEPAAYLEVAFPFITYVASASNTGFAGGNNLGLQYATGEYVFFVNNDTEVTPTLLDELVAYSQQHPDCGIACPKIKFYYQPNRIQYAGAMGLHPLTSRSYDIGFMQEDDGRFDDGRVTDLPNGAAMLVPMKLIRQIGAMSELFFLYYEELDWAYRFKKAGFKVHYVGSATIYHKESVSTGRNSPFKTFYLYRNRWLYIRRNYTGVNWLVSTAFFLFVSTPVHALKHLLKKEKQHTIAILKAALWNLHHSPADGRKKRWLASGSNQPLLVVGKQGA